jgi:lipoyl(octanoyl) transferase
MHGLAFNINTDLHYFNYIIPCGIVDQEKTVTSMSVELGMKIDQQEVKTQLKNHFCELFGMQLI